MTEWGFNMNVLVVGCGTVGSRLASTLSRMGHDVSVIDRNAESFDLLDNDFRGYTITGVPIDQDALRKAGIEGCDVVAAMTPNDSINVMVSQLAKEIFKVPKVLTRVYDPKRELVFAQFGLYTICPTALTVASAISILTHRNQVKYITFDAATMSLSTIAVAHKYDGHNLKRIEFDSDEVPVAIIRGDGQMTLVNRDTDIVVYSSDRLVLAKVVH